MRGGGLQKGKLIFALIAIIKKIYVRFLKLCLWEKRGSPLHTSMLYATVPFPNIIYSAFA